MPRHVCMLPKPPIYDGLHPTVNCWERLKRRWRNLLLISEWHHGSHIFFRSRKSIQLEQERQLKSTYWMVCHPYSLFALIWDAALIFIGLFAGLYLPWQVFRECPSPADPVILVFDFLACCDIVVKFFTGYNIEGMAEIVLEPKQIALNYLKGTFVIDFIAALPLQLYQPFKNCRYPSHTVFFPIKLLCFRKFKKKFFLVTEQLGMSYSCTVLSAVTIKLILFLHWLTYWQYQVPAFCTHYYDMDNLGQAEEEWLRRLNVDTTTGIFTKYITNLYHVCGRCIGAGYGMPVHSHVLPEMIQICITDTASLIFLIFCFMTVLRLFLCSQAHYFMFDGAMHDLEKYMEIKRLPKSLQQKIQMVIKYKFDGSYMDESAIMNTINEQIKHDINMHTCRQLVLNVPLFEDFPMALINSVIFSLNAETYIPGQVLIKCGQPTNSLYFIYYGSVAVEDERGRELKHLNDGAYFGEEALVHPQKSATFTVTAIDITKIYVLNNQQFETCIESYSQIRQRIAEKYHRFDS